MSTSEEQPRSESAELIRRRLAEAWGKMGAAWGVAPAIARVHIYLMARGEALGEREVREALGLSHRAASLALADAEDWGVVERVTAPRRPGTRGPVGTGYIAVGDHWQWFSRVIAHRKAREGDPIIAVLERTAAEASAAADVQPLDAELRELADWLGTFLVFVRLFDRAVGLIPKLGPRGLERSLGLVAQVPDDVALRLFTLLMAISDEDLVPLLDGLSRLSPAAARRTTRALRAIVRAERAIRPGSGRVPRTPATADPA